MALKSRCECTLESNRVILSVSACELVHEQGLRIELSSRMMHLDCAVS